MSKKKKKKCETLVISAYRLFCVFRQGHIDGEIRLVILILTI